MPQDQFCSEHSEVVRNQGELIAGQRFTHEKLDTLNLTIKDFCTKTDGRVTEVEKQTNRHFLMSAAMGGKNKLLYWGLAIMGATILISLTEMALKKIGIL